MSESVVVHRLKKMQLELSRRNEESFEKLKLLHEEYMKKPLEEQLKMARDALEYGF